MASRVAVTRAIPVPIKRKKPRAYKPKGPRATPLRRTATNREKY